MAGRRCGLRRSGRWRRRRNIHRGRPARPRSCLGQPRTGQQGCGLGLGGRDQASASVATPPATPAAPAAATAAVVPSICLRLSVWRSVSSVIRASSSSARMRKKECTQHITPGRRSTDLRRCAGRNAKRLVRWWDLAGLEIRNAPWLRQGVLVGLWRVAGRRVGKRGSGCCGDIGLAMRVPRIVSPARGTGTVGPEADRHEN